VTLPRGFRADAERRAISLRKDFGLKPTDPLNIMTLAENLNVKVLSAEKLVDKDKLEELERIQSFSFSAATFEVDRRYFIVTNPLRSPGRLSSDVAHELAHILLKHELNEVRALDGVPFRTCRPDEEEQATSYGATLLLPRPVLLAAAYRGMTPQDIAEEHNVTVEMARFRFNSSGVAKQAKR
jgi:Zn-dependent peptidase ImmA (M78 family)